MNRDDMMRQATERARPWDIVVIGGGATGAGIALDAATRGYAALLVERHDFGNGTSSRSTKLVHGGVRYLEQGNIRLVMEALRERERLLHNAPHLVRVQPFIVPVFAWWEAPFYAAGLKLYDWLAGRHSFGKSHYLSRREVLRRVPNIRADGLRGGIQYSDGQFDDARLLIDILRTASDHGAVVVNYARAVRLEQDRVGSISGVVVRDEEKQVEFVAPCRLVINATGAFCDELRQLADPTAERMVAPSQGAHLVLDRSFLPGGHAIMVPKTADGRVMFAIPWQGHTLLGTTDVAIAEPVAEPLATEAEVEFILTTAGKYLAIKPTRADVLSVFVGIRPLVKAIGAKNTAALSRDHTIHRDVNGLVTITGGKWTTYRNMAEDCVTQAAAWCGLPERRCMTKNLRIAGLVHASGDQLHPDLHYTTADVISAVRKEMARTVEDVLSRRMRALVLNANAAAAMAPQVAAILARELGRDEDWQVEQCRAFEELSRGYRLPM